MSESHRHDEEADPAYEVRGVPIACVTVHRQGQPLAMSEIHGMLFDTESAVMILDDPCLQVGDICDVTLHTGRVLMLHVTDERTNGVVTEYTLYPVDARG